MKYALGRHRNGTGVSGEHAYKEATTSLLKNAEGRLGHSLSESKVRKFLLSNGVRERHTKVNGLDVFYLESGMQNKETILLIHGGGNSSAYKTWKYQILDLADKYHVIAPDLPGYGRTSRPGVPCTLKYYVNDFVGKFMDSLSITKADVVGNSMGGGISIGFALGNPSRINKLVLIDSYGIYDKEMPIWIRALTAFPKLSKIALKVLSSNEDALRSALRDMTGNPDLPEEYIHMAREYFSDDDSMSLAFLEFIHDQLNASPRSILSDLLRQKHEHKAVMKGFSTIYLNRLSELNWTDIKILLVHGTEDPLFPLSSAENAASKLEHCTLVKFECGHGPQLEKPEEFTYELLKFLSQGTEIKTGGDEGKNPIKDFIKNLKDKFRPSA
ncbi:MAG: alpha/beta fold hydrolase [Candidatus Micrarchaeaceae archaeon]